MSDKRRKKGAHRPFSSSFSGKEKKSLKGKKKAEERSTAVVRVKEKGRIRSGELA